MEIARGDATMNTSPEERLSITELMQEIERRLAGQARAAPQGPHFITLQEWAKLSFSKVPHNNTLLRWVNEGRIQPQPEKIGRIWRVTRGAVYKAD
jgi:hypothetical protein